MNRFKPNESYEKDEMCCIHEDVVSDALKTQLDDSVLCEMADFYKVFGDSSRIRILYALLRREMCVGDLVTALNMSQSAVSHQLRILRQSDLVKNRKDGKTVYYSLDDEHVAAVLEQGLNHLIHKR